MCLIVPERSFCPSWDTCLKFLFFKNLFLLFIFLKSMLCWQHANQTHRHTHTIYSGSQQCTSDRLFLFSSLNIFKSSSILPVVPVMSFDSSQKKVEKWTWTLNINNPLFHCFLFCSVSGIKVSARQGKRMQLMEHINQYMSTSVCQLNNMISKGRGDDGSQSSSPAYASWCGVTCNFLGDCSIHVYTFCGGLDWTLQGLLTSLWNLVQIFTS